VPTIPEDLIRFFFILCGMWAVAAVGVMGYMVFVLPVIRKWRRRFDLWMDEVFW